MKILAFISTLVSLLMFNSLAYATDVEITLKDELDGKINSYCIDIAGGAQNVDPANGLQSHTCYSYKGALGTDQIFELESIAKGQLSMPVYNVCATLSGFTAGSSVELKACENSDLQNFVFSDDGHISPATDSSMCLTAGEETRSGKNSNHQIKTLSLETCSDELAAYQQWRTRQTDD